jgi:hypothetical protein
VRGERGRRDVGVLEEQERELLVVRVALRLPRPDRHGPAPLAGEDRLVVPVGALHEAHDDRAASPSSPRRSGPAGRARSRAGRPGARSRRPASAELVLGEDRAEERERQVLQAVALHVEVDEGPDLAALRRIGRSRSLSAAIERCGSAGWTSGVRAETFTERLTGAGAPWPEVAEAGRPAAEASAPPPCPGRRGCAAGRRRPRIRLTTVSPRRSIVVAIPEAALLQSRFTRSFRAWPRRRTGRPSRSRWP